MPKKSLPPEKAFRIALSSTYPGMSPEMRNGIVGLAVRAFITPAEVGEYVQPGRGHSVGHPRD